MEGYQVYLKGYEVAASFPSEMQEKLADVAREANEAGYNGDEVECDYKLVDSVTYLYKILTPSEWEWGI